MTKNSQLIISEALALGLEVDIISDKDHLFLIKNATTSMLVCELFSMTLDPNSEAYRLSKNKTLTYALWERAGIPFPKFYHVKSASELQEKILNSELSFPVITKEGGGSKSINVHMDIRSKIQLEEAAKTYTKGFLVQEMVVGKEYRLLLCKGKLIGALQMLPPQIVGDGKQTIGELIAQANKSKEKKIKITSTVLTTLEKSEHSLESVLPVGEIVLLQKNSRLSEGGESRDCTDQVHPEIVALAWRAVAATNLGLGGIDLICADISAPLQGQPLTFLEVNTYPDLTIHYTPTTGKSQPVARLILEKVFYMPPKK